MTSRSRVKSVNGHGVGMAVLVTALVGSFGWIGTFIWKGYQARDKQEQYEQAYYDLARVCIDRDGTMKQADQGAVCVFQDGTSSELLKPADW